MDERYLETLMQALGPEGVQAMMQAGGSPEALALASQKSAMGAGWMDAPSARGQNVGGTYVAASPLEHLSTAMSKVLGAQQVRDGRQSQADIMAQVMDAKNRYARAMALGSRPEFGPPEAPSASTPPLFGPGY